MASSKVGAHPPSNPRISYSPLSCKSELNVGFNDELKGELNCLKDGVKGGSKGSTLLPIESSDLEINPEHWIFRASPFPPSPLLPSTKLWESVDAILTVDCDCRSCNQPRGGGTTKIANGGFVGVHGYLHHQHHPRGWRSYLGQTNFPVHLSVCDGVRCFGFSMPEPLYLPACPCFDVQEQSYPTAFQGSQNCAQVGKQDREGFTITTETNTITNANAAANSMHQAAPSVTSLLPAHEEASSDSSKNCGDIISGSHRADEISSCDDIHTLGNSIHAIGDSEAGSEYYSDSDQYDDNDECPDTPSFRISKPSTVNTSSCVEANSSINDCHLQLKKLLSDESGYYEASSSEARTSPCDWSLKDAVVLDSEDIEEWDDDESTDGEYEADETADLLWKSFEDCALSPQTFCTKPETTPLSPCTDSQSANVLTTDSVPAESMMQLDIDQLSRPVERCASANGHTASCLCTGRASCLSDTPPSSNNHVTAMDTVSLCPSISTCAQATVSSHHFADPLEHSSRSKGCSHKQVHFPSDSSISVVHEIVAWDYAYRAARKGPWELYARNRAHFRRKIDKLALVLEPCLAKKMADGIGLQC